MVSRSSSSETLPPCRRPVGCCRESGRAPALALLPLYGGRMKCPAGTGRMTGSTGNSRGRAGNSGISWDLMGFGGIGRYYTGWDQPSRPPWRSLRPGAHGGISGDPRAESPAISKDFRPAKPSRELEVITHHTPFVPGTMFLSVRPPPRHPRRADPDLRSLRPLLDGTRRRPPDRARFAAGDRFFLRLGHARGHRSAD